MPQRSRLTNTIDGVWTLAAEGKLKQALHTASAHDDLYDEDGLPR
ncbi:hypothetical protein [Rhizobium sullae]|uniref:Uncharacterized protein n=1 Tax=Rhizobium sullae TaxID=50338 RepID=A0A4R3Q039_RHISU|nr:hypothetical protein [Rhizobium sullae]TCU13949.1 hypothetical protein EV132_11026 [Rhizobium sullae]